MCKNSTGEGAKNNKPLIPMLSTEPINVFRFRQFTLDLVRGVLRAQEQELELRPQSFLVLKVLVENHGRLVSKEQLHQQVWKGAAVTDDSLTHCIADIRKVLGDSDRKLIRTMPRRGYMLDATVETGEPAGSGRRTDLRPIPVLYAGIGVAAIVAVALVLWSATGPAGPGPASGVPNLERSGNSIAVLPFIDLSEERDLHYFGESISEEVITLLSQSPQLHVIARTSSFSFQRENADARTIAQRLNARFILEGSVRHAGESVRAIAQLVDTLDDKLLWSKSFDLPSGDVVDLQLDIVLAVAGELGIGTDVFAPASRSTDPNTFSLFSHARHLINSREPEQLPIAIDLLKRALERDPNFIRAITELGRAYYNQGNLNQVAWDEALDNAFSQTRRALEIAPDDPIANAWMGWRVMLHYKDYAEAARRYRRAFDADPRNVDIIRGFVGVLLIAGRTEDAVGFADFLIAHDPLCTICQRNRNLAYVFSGRYAEAAAHLRTLVALYPESTNYANMLAEVLLLQGSSTEALAILKDRDIESAESLTLVSIAHHRAGQLQQYESSLRMLEEIAQQSRLVSPIHGAPDAMALAIAYAATGNHDAAFVWLERCYEAGRFYGPAFRHPLLAPLREDARWNGFLTTHDLTDTRFAEFDLAIDVPRLAARLAGP